MKYKRRFRWSIGRHFSGSDANEQSIAEGVLEVWTPNNWAPDWADPGQTPNVELHTDGRWYIGPPDWLKNEANRWEPSPPGPFETIDEAIQMWELFEGLKQFPEFTEVEVSK